MELYCCISVLDRDRRDKLVSILNREGAPLTASVLGEGTASHEILSLYQLEASEKVVVAAIATAQAAKNILKAAKRELYIDIPGNGIMMTVPIKSVAGGSTLAFFTDGAALETEKAKQFAAADETKPAIPNTNPAMRFDYELIVVVVNEGYVDPVMERARSQGATGGTVLHAKGTGGKNGDKFFGMSLADEKETVLIVARTDKKAAIMRAVIKDLGPTTPAAGLVFSMPISMVEGLRRIEEN